MKKKLLSIGSIIFTLLAVVASVADVMGSSTNPVTPFNNAGGYDSTHTLATSQKYAIPEAVTNGDVVGKWYKTFTWRSGGTQKYEILTNFQSAFAINQATGVISIADATKINGKVVTQDTTINLIIKSIDNVMGYELDTAYIRVKENAYCRFIDFAYTGTESGTKTQPYNDFNDFTNDAGWYTLTAGNGYFIKRGGSQISGKTYNLSALVSTLTNPLIIGAYGSGENPIFDCTGNTTADGLFIFRNQYLGATRYWTNVYVYDLFARNYPEQVFRVYSGTKYMGIYNMKFQDNIEHGYAGDLGDIYFYGVGADSTYANIKRLEVINAESAGSKGPIIKSDATGVYITNVKAQVEIHINFTGSTVGSNLRVGMSYSFAKHFYLIGGLRSLQARYSYSSLTDGVIEGAGTAGFFGVLDHTYSANAYKLIFDNILFRRNVDGWYNYDGGQSYWTIKNCKFDRNTGYGMYFRSGVYKPTIQRCTFVDNPSGGIYLENSGGTAPNTDLVIQYNTFKGQTRAIACGISHGTGTKLYNNTMDGTVAMTGTGIVAKNNFYKTTLSGIITSSNNINIVSITAADYFTNYTTGDFRLKNTATLAIDGGFDLNLTPDIQGTAVGDSPDIGAYEYKGGLTSNIPIQRNNQKGIRIYPNPTTGIVHIRFDNFTENTYQSEWLKVTDLYGRPGFQKTLGAFLEGNQGKLDLSGLQKGFYIICLGNRMVEKLVLQ